MNDKEDKIKVGFDLTDAKRGETELRRIFENVSGGMKILESGNVSLTRQGQLTYKQFTAMDQSGQKFIATMKQATDAVLAYNKAGKLYDTATGQMIKQSGIGNFILSGAIKLPDTKEDTQHERALLLNASFDKKREFQREMALRMDAAFDRKKQVELGTQMAYEEEIRQKALLMDKTYNLKIIEQHENALRINKEFDQRKQLQFGTELAKEEQMMQKALLMNNLYNRKMEEQTAIHFLNEQKLHNQAVMQNKQVDRKKYLLDWSQAVDEDRFRSAPTYFDKLLNQAAAITTGIVISQVFMRIAGEITNAITKAAEFEIKISEIRTLSQQAQQTTGEWADQIKNLSDRFGVNIMDVASGTYETLSNQIAHGAESATFMAEAMKFAAVTMSTTTDAVNLLSSGINSYGLSVNDTSTVAATFFKMIDLGRIKAPELANSIGSITALTSQLKIPLNDVGAALSVMTNQGVTAANAMTYMRGITTSLLKPTKEMKETFKEWGVTSGEMAIKTFSLVGVMHRLGEVMEKGGLADLAKDEPNIRGLLGTSLLTGSNFNKFESEIKQFQNSISGYSDKIAIAFESPGKKLQIFWQQLSNFFLTDFGTKFINFTGNIVGGFGDLDIKLRFLTKTLEFGAIAWLAYKAAMIDVKSIATGCISAFNTLSNVMNNLGAFAMANPWVALAAAIGATIAAIYVFSETNEEVMKRVVAKAKTAADDLSHTELEMINRREQKFKQIMEERSKIQNEALAKERIGYTKSIDEYENKLKELEEAIKESADVFKESFGESIKQVQDNFNKLKDIIKETESHINSFAKRENTKAFEDKLEGMTPFGKTRAESQEAMRLRGEAAGLRDEAFSLIDGGNAAEGDVKLKQARERFDEALQMMDRAKKNDKEGIKGQVEPFKDPLVKKQMFDEIIKHQGLYNQTLTREQQIKKDVELMDQEALRLSKEKAEFAEQQLSKNKQFRVQMFDQLKEVDKFKVTEKDTPDTIKSKIDKITAAQGNISVAGDVFNVAQANDLFGKLEDKKNDLQAIYDSQNKLNQLNEQNKNIEEQKIKSSNILKNNTEQQKKDTVKMNEALMMTKELTKETLRPFASRMNIPNIDETADSPQTKILYAEASIARMEKLKEEIDRIKGAGTFQGGLDAGNSTYKMIEDLEIQARSLKFYSEDYLKRNSDNIQNSKTNFGQGEKPNQVGSNTSNSSTTYGDIVVNVTGTKQMSPRELAIEIRRELQRGTVPSLV